MVTLRRPTLRVVFGLLGLAIGFPNQACNVQHYETCPTTQVISEGEPCKAACTWCGPDYLDAGGSNGVCAASEKASVPSTACHFGICRRACSEAQPTCKTGVCCVMQVPDIHLADACGLMKGTACVPEAECNHPAEFPRALSVLGERSGRDPVRPTPR